MSLDWSITDVANWESISMKEENGKEAQLTHALIWGTLSIGLPGITAKNAAEFFWRIKVLEREDGAFVRYLDADKKVQDVLMERADIDRRIGLSTNVSTEGRTVWVSRQLKRWQRDRKLDEAAVKVLRQSVLADAPSVATRKAKKATPVSTEAR